MEPRPWLTSSQEQCDTREESFHFVGESVIGGVKEEKEE